MSIDMYIQAVAIYMAIFSDIALSKNFISSNKSLAKYIGLITQIVALEIIIGLSAKEKKGVSLILKVFKVDKNNINKEIALF